MIVFVNSDLRMGGAEVLRATVCRELANRGVDTIVVTFESAGDCAAEFAANGTRFVNLNTSRSIYRPATTWKLARELARLGPQVVQSGQFNSNFHARVAGRLARVPVIISEEHGFNTWKGPHHRFVDRVLSKWSDRVVAVSQAVKHDVMQKTGIANERVEVLHNCVDGDRFDESPSRDEARHALGLDDDAFVVGHVGTLRTEKDHATLLRGFQLCADESWRLVLVGDGPLRVGLEELARDLGVGDRVIFLGPRSDVPAVLSAFDVFAFPSVSEGLGIAVLEAMWAGLPVVVSDEGGLPEIVDRDRTGLVIPKGDAEALARSLTTLCAKPEMARRLGDEARIYAMQHHSPAAYVDALLDLHKRCLEASRPS